MTPNEMANNLIKSKFEKVYCFFHEDGPEITITIRSDNPVTWNYQFLMDLCRIYETENVDIQFEVGESGYPSCGSMREYELVFIVHKAD